MNLLHLLTQLLGSGLQLSLQPLDLLLFAHQPAGQMHNVITLILQWTHQGQKYITIYCLMEAKAYWPVTRYTVVFGKVSFIWSYCFCGIRIQPESPGISQVIDLFYFI